MTKEQIKNIPVMLESLTVKEIAESYKVHPQSIHYWIKRLKADGFTLPVRARGRKKMNLND